MLGQFLSAIGGNIGGYFGGGILSTIGRYAGRMAGNYLERKWQRKEVFQKYTNLKDGFQLSTANYGSPIPLIFGKTRCEGKIIWADKIKEVEITTTTKRYFQNPKQTKSTTHNTELQYYLSFAMAICEGEILEISRIWNGDEILDISNYKFRIFLGSEEQLPDPLILSKNDGNAPAFRDLSYILFEELPLADFDDCIPNLSFEVTRKANIKRDSTVEDIVKSIVMIPGTGEYVYDTKIQTKTHKTPDGIKIKTVKINSHNFNGIANSIQSLNQLQQTCENIEWVSPVVCWFGNSSNAGNCELRPAIEFNDPQTEYSEEWRVAGYNRNNAYQISKDKDGSPKYGGSVSDASVIRYLQELKKRELKIMFYPMFFLDVDMKPWRGRLTGSPSEIKDFFQKKNGYNEFILHYANLVKDHVDVFVIGSELIGLTKVQENYKFPAVDELIHLSFLVKKIVGTNVLVTYAADWSEYHHTDGGWFNLDPLWSSPSIDFIGIDAYFPVTGTTSSTIAPDDIAQGWMSGEGFDYYVDYTTGKRHPLSAKYAWKNLRYWWENKHKNPDGSYTTWQPKSKKIWFTEFGFPSIDKATNQPNVFFDPFCLDGGVPRESSGEVDFSIQRRAIRAFIEYWQAEEYIGQMFLWTWDARPYPAWPHMNVWRDGYLWEKGHWVNNKFGASSLASIILEISVRCGINPENIEVSSVDESVEGLILSKQLSALDAIDILRTAYFFDISACRKNIINFIKRGKTMPLTLSHRQLIKLSENSCLRKNEVPEESVINKINLSYISPRREYINSQINVTKESHSNHGVVRLNLPIVLSSSEAERIGELILTNAATERSIIEFILPINCVNISATDFVLIEFGQLEYQLRIISTKIKNLTIEFTGIIDDINTYYQPTLSSPTEKLTYHEPIENDFFAIDLPLNLANMNSGHFTVYLNSDNRQKLFFSLLNDPTEFWHQISNLSPSNSIAKIVEFNQPMKMTPFLIDKTTKILVRGENLESHFSVNWQFVLAGNEIIRFKTLEKLEGDIYQISNLTRGEYGTEKFINNHKQEECFIFLERGANVIPVQDALLNQPIILKIGKNLTKEFVFTGKASHALPPFITQSIIEGNKLKLRWVPRTLNHNSWQFPDEIRSITYLVKVSLSGAFHEFETIENELEVDLVGIELSGDLIVDIIPKTIRG